MKISRGYRENFSKFSKELNELNTTLTTLRQSIPQGVTSVEEKWVRIGELVRVIGYLIADEKKVAFRDSMDIFEEKVEKGKSKVKVVANSAQCLNCKDILFSRHGRDYVTCSCGEIFLDGGTENPRRGYKFESGFLDLSKYEEVK